MRRDSPDIYYRLGEPTARPTTAADSSGNGNAGTYFGTETKGVSGPVDRDDRHSRHLQRHDRQRVVEQHVVQQSPAPTPRRLGSRRRRRTGGKLIGFGSADRHVERIPTATSTWRRRQADLRCVQRHQGDDHLAERVQRRPVAPRRRDQGTSDGMKLYVDGFDGGEQPEHCEAQAYTGYWRIGGDTAWNGSDVLRRHHRRGRGLPGGAVGRPDRQPLQGVAARPAEPAADRGVHRDSEQPVGARSTGRVRPIPTAPSRRTRGTGVTARRLTPVATATHTYATAGHVHGHADRHRQQRRPDHSVSKSP